jgi:hypothetical protein
MFPFKRSIRSIIFAGVILIAGASYGCAAHVRVYDEYHSDYHPWDRNEVVVYRQYWAGRNQPYREYNSLNRDEQREYWNWRHDHPGAH